MILILIAKRCTRTAPADDEQLDLVGACAHEVHSLGQVSVFILVEREFESVLQVDGLRVVADDL